MLFEESWQWKSSKPGRTLTPQDNKLMASLIPCQLHLLGISGELSSPSHFSPSPQRLGTARASFLVFHCAQLSSRSACGPTSWGKFGLARAQGRQGTTHISPLKGHQQKFISSQLLNCDYTHIRRTVPYQPHGPGVLLYRSTSTAASSALFAAAGRLAGPASPPTGGSSGVVETAVDFYGRTSPGQFGALGPCYNTGGQIGGGSGGAYHARHAAAYPGGVERFVSAM
ncbi:Forkhead box protein E1 [Tupaia chinensis]|uniref:Forkhead box protein E1 n=1 Tax=Tupaia chinensis TaxID=246437 RepID=L9L4F6_TUPCH|nr:Forkhead box protein E1 [Tupaia chinensis]